MMSSCNNATCITLSRHYDRETESVDLPSAPRSEQTLDGDGEWPATLDCPTHAFIQTLEKACRKLLQRSACLARRGTSLEEVGS